MNKISEIQPDDIDPMVLYDMYQGSSYHSSVYVLKCVINHCQRIGAWIEFDTEDIGWHYWYVEHGRTKNPSYVEEEEIFKLFNFALSNAVTDERLNRHGPSTYSIKPSFIKLMRRKMIVHGFVPFEESEAAFGPLDNDDDS